MRFDFVKVIILFLLNEKQTIKISFLPYFYINLRRRHGYFRPCSHCLPVISSIRRVAFPQCFLLFQIQRGKKNY